MIDNSSEATKCSSSIQMPHLNQYDIIVVGAGPAGLSMAASLADSDVSVLVVEKLPEKSITAPAVDGRDIALTHHSKELLTSLDVWQRFGKESISPINQAKVLDGDSDYILEFSALSELKSSLQRSGEDDGALGYLVPNHIIRKALFDRVSTLRNVEFLFSAEVVSATSDVQSASIILDNGTILASKMLIAADSRFSPLRRQMGIAADMEDFGRSVIVCRVNHERRNEQVAYECFKYGGTLAVLPTGESEASVVVTVSTDKADLLMQQSEVQFNNYIGKQFKHRLGAMALDGDRHCYPLVAVLARRFTAKRFALIGDAAVGMHPVTAHGFNLGLRSQDSLSKRILSERAQQRDIASDGLLHSYNREHRRQCLPIYYGTNLLVRLFTNDRLIPKVMRKAVLRISNNLPPVKRRITDHLTDVAS